MECYYLKQSLNIFLLQSIIVKNHYNSKYHYLIIMIMLGRIGIGRVFRGTMKVGQQVCFNET